MFVDDNPIERARVRQSLPMVAVPELPEDPAHYVRCLAEAGYFEAVAFTAEDRDRAQSYAANAEREALLGSAESMDDFLRGLAMTAVYGPFTAVDHARVVQLINKTNQFNTTTRRYAGDEVARIMEEPGRRDPAIPASRPGRRQRARQHDDPAPGGRRREALEIENWVMSCRVFGRELEFEAMNIAVEAAKERGVRALVANYIPTPKNDVISKLYLEPGLHRGRSPGARQRGDALGARSRRLRPPEDSHRCARAAG